MALTETTKIDLMEVLENCSIQVRMANIISRDEVEISRTYNRHVVVPGEDVSREDSKVQAVATALWTEEVIAAYRASLNNN
jgi:hypothetical protein